MACIPPYLCASHRSSLSVPMRWIVGVSKRLFFCQQQHRWMFLLPTMVMVDAIFFLTKVCLNPITNGRDFLNRVVQRQNNDVQTDEERFFVSTFKIKIKNRYRTHPGFFTKVYYGEREIWYRFLFIQIFLSCVKKFKFGVDRLLIPYPEPNYLKNNGQLSVHHKLQLAVALLLLPVE